MLRCEMCTGSATCKIDLRGDFGWTAQLENGFARKVFGSIMKKKKEEKGKKRKKERRSPFFETHLATLYRVHVALLFVIHLVGNLCRTWKMKSFLKDFPGKS